MFNPHFALKKKNKKKEEAFTAKRKKKKIKKNQFNEQRWKCRV